VNAAPTVDPDRDIRWQQVDEAGYDPFDPTEAREDDER
jgi:hypothetical protein